MWRAKMSFLGLKRPKSDKLLEYKNNMIATPKIKRLGVIPAIMALWSVTATPQAQDTNPSTSQSTKPAATASSQTPRTTPTHAVDFDPDGAIVLTLDGKVITEKPTSANDNSFLPAVAFRPADAKMPTIWGGYPPRLNPVWPLKRDGKPLSSSFDPATKELTQKYAWGEIVRAYKIVPNGVDIEITVKNTSPETLCEFQQRLLTLRTPLDSYPACTTEAMFFGQGAPAISGEVLSGPVALPLPLDSSVLVASTRETRKPLSLVWGSNTYIPPAKRVKPEHNDPVAKELAAREETALAERGDRWFLNLNTGGDKLLFHEKYTSRPIPPGGSDTYQVALRFGRKDAPLANVDDLLKAYGKANPMAFSWPDRRPILATFIGDKFPCHWPEGPTLSKPQGVVSSPEFREKLLKGADSLIADLKAMNAQGCIVWNIEGNGPSWLQYVGDPHLVEFMCPEADAVADEFFQKIRDAGFRTGVCLRPSVVDVLPESDFARFKAEEAPSFKNPDNKKFSFYHSYPHPKRSPADILCEKIAYAKKRWGCTIFYVDTNDGAGFWPSTEEEKKAWPKEANGRPMRYMKLLSEDVWIEVLRRHPDVLLVLEHTPLMQYRVTAPYDGWQTPIDGTPAVVRATWPEAFKCLVPSISQDLFQLAERVRDGDVVMNVGPFQKLLQKVGAFLEEGAPKELESLTRAQLLVTATDASAPEINRFYAAKALCKGELTAEEAGTLLAAPDPAVKFLAIERLDSRDKIKLQFDPLLALIDAQGKWGLYAGTIAKVMGTAGPGVLEDLAVHAKGNLAAVKSIMGLTPLLAGPKTIDLLTGLIADSSLPDKDRLAVAAGACRMNGGTAEQKEIVAAFLTEQLNDPKNRRGAAAALRDGYTAAGALLDKDPKVKAAAQAAAEAEKSQPEPDKDFLATLDQILNKK